MSLEYPEGPITERGDPRDRISNQRECDRLARQVADLEAALREITGVATDLPHARRLDRERMRRIAYEALDALAAARSREQQEPQT